MLVTDVRKPDLEPLGPFIVCVVEDHVTSERLPEHALGRLDASGLTVSKTASRSVLGTMNDAARLARYQIEAMGGLGYADIDVVNRILRRTPNNVGGELVTPLQLVARRLETR